MRDYFLNHGLTKEEADILTEYCERSGNTKERALDFADEILAEYVVRQSELSNAAAALGRKGGQAKSEKKAATARENGKKPCAPGKKRGRPRRERGMKKGDIVMVYEDPLTKKKPIENAKVLHIYSIDKITGLTLCDLKYLSDGLKTTARV